jgi:hypothetical protein
MIRQDSPQCDFCLSLIPLEYITASNYPYPKIILYKGCYTLDGKHICDKCYADIRQYDKAQWLKNRDVK